MRLDNSLVGAFSQARGQAIFFEQICQGSAHAGDVAEQGWNQQRTFLVCSDFRNAATRVATTGTPAAMASNKALGDPSLREESTAICAMP